MESKIETAFNIKVKKSLSCWLRNARKSETRPHWIHPSVWERLKFRWENDENFLKLSKRGTNNRNSNCGGRGPALHTLGRMSLAEKKALVAESYGREPTPAELFKESHKRKDGSFVNQRAENTANDLQNALDAATQEEGPVNHEQLYLDVVGTKGGRVYGMGDHSAAMIRRSKATSSRQIPSTYMNEDPFPDPNDRVHMQRQVNELSIAFNFQKDEIKANHKEVKGMFAFIKKMVMGKKKARKEKGKNVIVEEEELDEDDVEVQDEEEEED